MSSHSQVLFSDKIQINKFSLRSYSVPQYNAKIFRLRTKLKKALTTSSQRHSLSEIFLNSLFTLFIRIICINFADIIAET